MSDGHGHAEHGAEDHGHGHGHGSRFIQHHYDDAQHQFDSGKLGIWLFLAQEVLFFSALFVAYVLYRHHHPEIYGYAHKYLDVKYGAINTGVLIFSSLTAAWAVRAAQLRQQKLLVGCLFVTILCACTFLGIKYIEYSHKYHEQILFGHYFDPCVTSGDTPLLTKKNQCPGHQTSVYLDSDVPQTGCFPVIAIDRDPAKPGVQLDCTVQEAGLRPIMEPKKDEKGNPVQGGELVHKTDKFRRWLFDLENPKPVTKRCDPAKMHTHNPESEEGCWLMSAQPAVCRPGFYFTESCAADGTCNADWKRRSGTDNVAEISARYNTSADCEEQRKKRSTELREAQAVLDDAFEAAKKTDPAAKPAQGAGITVSLTCIRSEAVGFVVDHGDHRERHDRYAVATCEPPPKPPAATDLHAEVSNTPKLGEGVVAEHEVEADEHERLYLGPPPEHTNMFFTIYFAMTGLHGIHVLVGVLVFIWLLIRAIKGHFTPDYFGPVDFAALYWHIVDLIWIFLFPLLYLIH